MPALWQASQRPMYVRTVWVGGFRHAILSPDDPYLALARARRPHSSATCSSKLIPRRRNSRLSDTDNLEDCLRNFNFVIKNEDARQRPKSSPLSIEKLDLTEVERDSDLDFRIEANAQPLYEYQTSRSKFEGGGVYLNMRTLKSNRTARSEANENNELSERVLQWLDLAGKVDLLAPEKVERMTLPRHSWPEIQRRNHNLSKSKTVIDMRAKESKVPSPKVVDSAKAQQSGPIDRHDFYVPVSANTIENYARQSRNHSTPPNDTPKTKDNKTKSKELRTNILEARKKIASERTAMEKQYADLISKKLIPDLKGNKKQVHIFIPEMAKKAASNTNSNATSRTESLLSQFSQMSQKSK